LISLADVKQVSANPGTLLWTTVDTPSLLNNVIVSPSEINFIAIGSDDNTFYAVDIPDFNTSGSRGRLFKSRDGGVTWPNELSAQLIAAGASMPVWNIAVAPDDVNFLVAITDGSVPPPLVGPKQVYISMDGGATWQNANFAAAAGEWISCVDISVMYGGTNRDIAIGTRTGTGAGKVYVRKSTSFGAWADQGLVPSDVVALKFSPAYTSDSSLVVVSSDTGTFLRVGFRDTANNTTDWVAWGAPAEISTTGISPTAAQIITADLELPSDFSGQDVALRHFYVSTDATPNVLGGVYRVDDNVPNLINPPTPGRISSIAYFGSTTAGTLLAGEVTAGELAPTPSSYGVHVWRTSNPNVTVGTPTWLSSDARRSPTGGAGSGLANAQVSSSPDGSRAYCGTNSACLGIFTVPTGAVVCSTWPDGYLNGVALDESAFSVSPYSLAYSQQLAAYSKTEDTDIGKIWNQLSLIDTEMDSLSDVAALEAPETGENLAPVDYNVLYLFSINANIPVSLSFDSLWRSTSDPLGRTWERVLCIATSDTGTILRVKQTSYEETDRSDVIVFADLGPEVVGISANEGQAWDIRSLTTVTDLALASDAIIYVLNNTVIYKYEREGTNWVFKNKVNTGLDAGHTIAVPLKNPSGADIVLVGEAGTPNGLGRIAYADFSQPIVTVNPPISERIAPPIAGDAHVIFDDKYEQNGIIYNATRDPIGGNGKIYRWTIGKSTAWSELEPPNSAFYGLVQRNDVLYGAWKKPEVPAIAANSAGVDRTLYPRRFVPPPPEWDYLTEGLLAGVGVIFTREPSSLKISSNKFNSLWAIDNNTYNFANNTGRLWEYTDTLAKVGPWTTSPASGDFIPVDPVSGRALEVNFAWRSLSNALAYELEIANDSDFTIVVLRNEYIVPVDSLSPEVYFPAGGLVPTPLSGIAAFGNLEAGHTYYWRVRARTTVNGEATRSPWSATMYFTVGAGLPIASRYPTMTLFSPMYGAKNVSNSPAFSWSGMPGTTKYEFVLAKDAALQKVIVKVDVPSTSYLYDGKLDYNTGYYWQVRAIEPVVSDPSPIGTFTVVAEQKPVTPVVETPAPIPSWVWWIIAIFAALVVAIIAFTMVKPSYVRPAGGGKLFKIEPISKAESGKLEKVEPLLGKPKNPIAKIWGSIIMAIRRWRYLRKRGDGEPVEPISKAEGGKLDNVKPIVNKLKSRIAKIWASITMAVRRWGNFKRRADTESEDSGSEVGKSQDSQNKLT